MGRASKNEIEIKLPVADVRMLLRRLRGLKAKRIGSVHERNVLFDTRERTLARAGKMLRLRWNNRDAVLTFKAPAGAARAARARAARHKVRSEIEFPLAAPQEMARVLEGLGFHAGFQYEKFRTTFRLRRAKGLKLELDVTPIGCLLELEGAARQIDRVARLLGYARNDYITANYFTLYREHCRRHGQPAGHMLFSARRRRATRK